MIDTDLFPDGPLQRVGRRVELFTRIDSTNTYLLAHAAELGDGVVAVAELQTAGRGRQGRRWIAPRGSSILLSVLLVERQGSLRITYAAMLAALAASEAVETETSCHASLRWPNDLIVSGKKLGGVLAESTPLPFGAPSPRRFVASSHLDIPLRQDRDHTKRALVIGVGLNCFQQPGHFNGELSKTATSLEIESPQPIDRAAVARRLLERLDAHLAHDSHRTEDWEWLLQAWSARCDDLGSRVTLEESSRRYTGTVLEIADNGDLVVQLDDGGRRRFESATTTRIR